ALLRETLEARSDLPEVFARLLEAYLSRDLARLERLGDEYLRRGDPQLAARFRHAALEVRNQHMTARMLAYLRAGGCFIAIGALHLPGEGGVLARLTQAGFSPRALD
ncbi:MAG TPA: TraB/GumN family protein, partial [Chromatiaceae bacterium]|nr:TraB/GumN family protein [Chromatiaceae bacterium]